MNDQCARAEILAGAIALGEPSAAQRDEYRLHISTCARCLEAFGGEREIERVMSLVSSARESETWEPVPVRWNARGARGRSWQTGILALTIAVAVSFGLHALIARSIRTPAPVTVAQAQAHAAVAPVFHVTLERRPDPPRPTSAPRPRVQPPAQRRMVVVHNVIARRGKDVTETTISTTEVAEVPIPQITAPPSNVPIWRRDQAMPRPSAPTPAPVLTGHAESIAVAPITVIRDVEPVGGDAAISPRPAPIAYAQGAYGTTAFEVQVDPRGVPTRCSITKSSGFASLDVSVCRAAMSARYMPRLVNGKPTVGVYRDAFTFRQLNDDDGDL